jgi:hypothetical protein
MYRVTWVRLAARQAPWVSDSPKHKYFFFRSASNFVITLKTTPLSSRGGGGGAAVFIQYHVTKLKKINVQLERMYMIWFRGRS